MFYAILLVIGLVVSYKLYFYSQQFFDDGIDYTLDTPQVALSKHIQNTVICANKDSNKSFFQIHNLSVPTEYGSMKIESILVSNSGIYVLNSHDYPYPVVKTDFGFHKNLKKGKNEKLYISSVPDQNIINHIYALFPELDHLKVHFYHVFISAIKFKVKQPEHVIKLNQFNSIISSNENLLTGIEVALISGTFRYHDSRKTVNQKF